jgi:hypothetical protein
MIKETVCLLKISKSLQTLAAEVIKNVSLELECQEPYRSRWGKETVAV